MELTQMSDRTYHEYGASQGAASNNKSVPPGTTRTGNHRTQGHHFEAFTIQDNARVHAGDLYSGQHIHYHAAPPSFPPTGETSLLDALAFEQMDFRSATIAPAYFRTCNWLFSAPPYQRWRDQDLVSEHNGFLWIKGKPGAGKSTLMKHACEHAQVAYGHERTFSFFFNARGAALGKSVEGMYRCLLHQMVGQMPHLERRVASEDRSAYRFTGWPVAVLQDLFCQAVIYLSRHTKVSFYIDALDEGDDEEQVRGMVEFFSEVAERAAPNSLPLHICLASRYYPKISVSSYEELRVEDYAGHDADILEYVHNKLRIGNLQLKQHLSTEVRRRSSRVFLWVVLVVAILNWENDRGNQHLLLTRLQEIPDDLLQLFEDLRKRDSSDNRFLPAIEWVLHAMRPLEPNELYIAILTSTNVLTAENFAWVQHNIDAGTVDDFIISSSKGFLEIGAATNWYSALSGAPSSGRRVQFIHETVREYFLVAAEFGDQSLGSERAQVSRYGIPKNCINEPLASTRKAVIQARVDPESPDDEAVASSHHPGSMPELRSRSTNDTIAVGHARLSQVCQTCIQVSYASDLQQDPQFQSTPIRTAGLDRRPFLRYSLEEVLNHANAASKNGWPVSNLAKDFPWDQWVYYMSARRYISPDHPYHHMYTWLQRMVYLGSPQLVEDELASISADAKRSQQGVETAEFLLNACASGLGSPLHIAVSFKHSDRHLRCLKLLLESGADVNKVCKDFGTPLHYTINSASIHDPHTVDVLLQHGADTNAKDVHGESPLHNAIYVRHSGLIKTVLGHGADPNAKDRIGNTPLHYAISAEDIGLVETLVGHGADLNGRIGTHGNAAQTARFKSYDFKFRKALAELLRAAVAR